HTRLQGDWSSDVCSSDLIAVVHRSDGSGTTSIWTDYLTKTSPTWVSALGAGKSAGKDVAWPTGIGGKGNEGVSGAVNQTDGALRSEERRVGKEWGTGGCT